MTKHNKILAALAAAGGFFAVGSAHAIAPAVAIGLAAMGGAAVGSTAEKANNPPVAIVTPANPTVVMGGPPSTTTTVVQEVVPAPRDGYTWTRGHYEVVNGVSSWVPGHWVANGDVVIYETR